MLTLSLASAMQIASTPVAPHAQGTITTARFYFTVKAPGKLCVGESKSISVTPLFDMSGVWEDGRTFTLNEHIFTGVSVAAEILDTGVATVAPASAKSGALTRDTFTSHSLQDQATLGNLGALEFTAKGVKAGDTALILTAQAPVPAGSNAIKYFGPSGMPPSIAIKVVPCKYEVIISQSGLANAGAVFKTSANMTTTISGNNSDQLSGSGTLSMRAITLIPGCALSDSYTTIPIKIEGTVSETQLNLKLNYVGGINDFGTATCIGRSGSASGSAPASFLFAVDSVTLPVEGGSIIRNYSCVRGAGSCSMAITAVPLEK